MKRRQSLQWLLGAAAGFALPPLAAQSARYDFWFTRLQYDSGDWDVDARMPSNLITSLIDYTTLRVDPNEHVVALSDPKMLAAPSAARLKASSTPSMDSSAMIGAGLR